MPQEVIEITEREIEIIEVIERGPVGPTGPQPDINYEVVSSARTLEAADLIAADTSGGAFTLTLPANPSNGDAVDIFDFSETFDTNPLTIARNGQPIESLNEDLVANVEGAYFTLIYTGATRGWQVLPRYGTSGGGGESALTTQGDMLYRGVGINTRLPIGSAGQILKVNSGATAPEWGEAPATGVTSVGVSGSDGIEVDSGSPVTGSGTIALGINAASLRSHINVADGANNYTHPNHSGEVTSSGDGATTIANDVVTNAKLANVATATIKGRATAGTGDPEDLSASQVRTILNVADGAEVNVQSNWTEADSGSDAFILNKPSSFTPSAHSSTHHTGGTDAIAPNQISAAWALEIRDVQTITADTTLTAGRNIQQQIDSYAAGNLNLTLPISGVQSGDSFTVVGRAISTGDIVIRKQNHDGSGFGPQFETLATVTANPEVYTFRSISATSGGWLLIPVDSHTQPASQITGLATVATTGDYDDLTDKPTIPTASSATPQSLGVAAAGTSSDFARADHVHAMPSAADVGAAPATGIDPTAISGTAVVDSDARLSDSRTPTSHASSHASAGSDPLAPSDLGLGDGDDVTFNSVAIEGGELKANSGALSILDADGPEKASLQVSNLELFNESTGGGYALFDAQGNLTGARIYDLPDRSGELMLVGDAPASHTHGNLTNDGKLGSTAGLPLKTGTAGVVEAGAFGTGAGEFAEGNHTHTQLHDRSHAITSTSDHTAGNHKVFYSDGSGQIQELALGNSGEVLTSNGATSAPSFAAASGGGVTTGSVDNAILRADGTGGSTSQSSDLVIDDAVVPFNITGDAGTDIITAVGHNFTANQGVRFPTLTGGSGLNTTTNYFVRDISGDTFKVSTTSGGSAVNFTTNITAGTVVAMQANVAIRNNSSETNSALVLTPKGTGALIIGAIPDGTTVGGNPCGNNAINAVSDRSAATQVASGAHSIALGYRATASGIRSIAIGATSSGQEAFAAGGGGGSASGNGSVCIGGLNGAASSTYAVCIGGYFSTASGFNSVSGGEACTASASYSANLGGQRALADRYAMQAHAAGRFDANGDAQRARFVLRCKTTTNAAVEMALDGSATYLTIPSGKVIFCNIKVVGVKSDGSAVATYERQYAAKNVAGTSSEVFAEVTIGTDNAASTSLDISTVDAGDYISIKPTGIASETWRWVASVDAVEVAYGS